MSSLSQFYRVIPPGSYTSPPGGKKMMKRFAYPARHIAGGDRRQSALVIMTDFGWNWLPTCDDKLFNFPPAQPPHLPTPSFKATFRLEQQWPGRCDRLCHQNFKSGKTDEATGSRVLTSLTFPNVESEHLLLLLQPSSLPRWQTRSTMGSSSAAHI